MVSTILLVFAFVFAVIGTFWRPYPANPPAPWYGRFSFLSAAFACYVLSLLLTNGHLANLH